MNAEMLKNHLKANCLGRGKTVSGPSLEHTLHISGNELRRQVNRLRREGVPIASSRDRYFGVPARAQRSGSRGERRSDGVSELFAVRRKRANTVRDNDRQLRRMEQGLAAAIQGLERALERFGGDVP